MRTQHKFIVLVGLAVLIAACASNVEHDNALTSGSTMEKSELAALMRVMEAHGDEVKFALKSGEPLPDRPDGIDGLLEATPTPKMHIDEATFPMFTQAYLNSVDRFYAANPKDRQEVFNDLVQSCENCHTVNCPGPLMKIEKMYFGEH